MLARWMPGLGHPMQLPIDDFFAYLSALAGQFAAESGDSSAVMANEMRRFARG